MKKLMFVMTLAAAVLCASCGSKKTATPKGETEVNVPCSEYMSDKTAVRATATADSPNKQQAMDKALLAARAEIATSLNVLIKRVSDRYSESYESNNAVDYKGKFEDITRQVVREKLQGSVPVCKKLTQNTDKQGNVMYHGYVAVEITANDLVQEINTKVSNDEQMRIDFDYEKFKKELEAEMSAFEK